MSISTAKFVNYNEKDETTKIKAMSFLQFRPLVGYVLVPILCICTGLIFALALHWSVTLRVAVFYSRSKGIEEGATHVLIQGESGNIEVQDLRQPIHDPRDEKKEETRKTAFTYRFVQFEFDFDSGMFEPVVFNATDSQESLIKRFSSGVFKGDLTRLRGRFGPCQLDVPMPNFFTLLILEVLNPFYIFQVFAVWLWIWDGYEKYAYCILGVSILGIFESMYITISNTNAIRKMARFHCDVEVKRRANNAQDSPAETIKVPSEDLVPGDIIVIPDNQDMPCDAVLLSGSAIVNEAMLTGESVPMIKNGIGRVSEKYDPTNYAASKKHTLYNGTKVIQTRMIAGEQVVAMVTRTGFLTTKGSMVRDIIYPKPTKFQFERDSLIFVAAMALLAVLGFFIAIPFLVHNGAESTDIVDKSLDLLTITVPPALPATMSVGVAFAVTRLRRAQIFCVSPQRVNMSGMIQVMVFDKTGTLTEDGLEIKGVRARKGTEGDEKSSDFTDFCASIKDLMPKVENLTSISKLLQEAMASCQALTYVKDEIIGDPLELKMFQDTKWVLDEKAATDASGVHVLASVLPEKTSMIRLSILKRFDFEAQLMRMSTIVRHSQDESLRAYVKGSPEKIAELCDGNSIPKDYSSVLESYTKMGYRVIALAYKPLDGSTSIDTVPREEIESGLQFLGLLIMENKLKDATVDTIKTLNDCKIRTIMATGDNTLTAISVARACNIFKSSETVYFGDIERNQLVWKKTRDSIDDLDTGDADQTVQDTTLKGEDDLKQLETSQTQVPWETDNATDFGVALNGKTLEFLLRNKKQYEAVLFKILIKADVYARMSPDDKAHLVELLQNYLEVSIGMCGDGANDCGALKQADAGISLSEAEASIAAPFTSRIHDISCVITMLREGRAAMTTTFQAFKFVELYAFIQFFTVEMMYIGESNLSDDQFLVIDIAVLFPLCVFSTWTGAYEKLTPDLPQSSLFKAPTLLSVIGMALIQFVFQLLIFVTTKGRLGDNHVQCMYADDWEEMDPPCSENTALYFVSCIQYIICCLCFSVSKPFRKDITSNPLYIISVVLMLGMQVFLMVSEVDRMLVMFDLVALTTGFRVYLLILVAANTAISFWFERVYVANYAAKYNQKMEGQLHGKYQQKLKLMGGGIMSDTNQVAPIDKKKEAES